MSEQAEENPPTENGGTRGQVPPPTAQAMLEEIVARSPAKEVPPSRNAQELDLLKALADADRPRRQLGEALAFVGGLTILIAAAGAWVHITDRDLLDKELMQTPGYPYLVAARAVFGASILGVSFAVLQAGQSLMLPSLILRDMKRRGSESADDDDNKATIKSMAEALQRALETVVGLFKK